MVVLATTGRSHEGDWIAAAKEFGLKPDEVQHLYLSLQPARHADASRAREKLEQLDLEALTAPHCRDITGELLRAFARTSPRTVGPSQS